MSIQFKLLPRKVLSVQWVLKSIQVTQLPTITTINDDNSHVTLIQLSIICAVQIEAV